MALFQWNYGEVPNLGQCVYLYATSNDKKWACGLSQCLFRILVFFVFVFNPDMKSVINQLSVKTAPKKNE